MRKRFHIIPFVLFCCMACGVLSPDNHFYPHSFFEEWSNYIVPLQSDSLVNYWYAQIFDHYGGDSISAVSSKYVVLPNCIKVKYIDQSFRTIIDYDNIEVGGDTWIDFDSLSDNTLYVVPKIPSHKTILYLTPEIEKTLNDYLESGYATNANSPKKRHPDREKRISQYIPLSKGPSFSTYSYYTFPIVTELYFFDDGIVFELRQRGFSGSTVFLPDGQFESEYIVNMWIN